MMIGERKFVNPTVLVPPWNSSDGSTDGSSFSVSPNCNAKFNADDISSYLQNEALTALQRYLPSNDVNADMDGEDWDLPMDAYACDNFRMYDFKVRKCARAKSHDWTQCPYAHPGEKARRRDPRRYHYAGTSCPEFRKGYCKKGDTCEYAHGVFECWLHPARYRTQPCKDGVSCTRRVCFFAHTPSQLRILGPGSTSIESYDGSPRRLGSCARGLSFLSPGFSDTSSSSVESPPVSPIGTPLSRSLGSNSVNELVASLHQLHLNKVKLQMGSTTGFSSPKRSVSMTRPGFYSLPSTPTRTGFGYMDPWDRVWYDDEPVMERVESGRDLRVKMFEKLSKENPLDRVEPNPVWK